MKQEEGLKEQGPEGGDKNSVLLGNETSVFMEMVIDLALAKDVNKATKRSNAKIAKGLMLTY